MAETKLTETKMQKIDELTIVQQPPPIFANQQRGKRHGFDVAVKAHSSCARSAILKIELLYADDLTQVAEQSSKKRRPHNILQILEPASEFDEAGKATVRMRINDVSRNHRGRSFCLSLSVVNQGVTIASAHTNPIKVISKLAKGKRRRSAETQESCLRSTSQSIQDARTVSGVGLNNAVTPAWRQCAFNLLRSLEKRVISDHRSPRPVTQCPSCHAFGNLKSIPHLSNCSLAAILRDFVQPIGIVSTESEADDSTASEEEPVSLCSEDFYGCNTGKLTEVFEKNCF